MTTKVSGKRNRYSPRRCPDEPGIRHPDCGRCGRTFASCRRAGSGAGSNGRGPRADASYRRGAIGTGEPAPDAPSSFSC